MPSITQESVGWETERKELQAVLRSPLFTRSPTLTHLLSYLCEKTFTGNSDQIKEYSVALDVFGRRESFDQNSDSIVRVQANRLRKRLNDYYASEGLAHSIHITIPVGQYIPAFESMSAAESTASSPPQAHARDNVPRPRWRPSRQLVWLLGGTIFALVIVVPLIIAGFFAREKSQPLLTTQSHSTQQEGTETVGLPVGEEVRILAGASRKYVDHAGKLWNPDTYFSGGAAVPSAVQHIWRTQDPIIYRSSRQGDFIYNIPLRPGTYELRLHFAETFYGPESSGGGGEGSRVMTLTANGRPLLRDFDVLADSGGDRTADVKVLPDISPAPDGELHLSFSSLNGSAMLSAIEILPGIHGRIRPVRIVARDVPYYSNHSQWWGPDAYFKGGQLASGQEPALDTDDPDFYETERWGHFSYAIPVSPGTYTATLYFIEHHSVLGKRIFNVFCNGKTILANLNIEEESGENRPFVRKIRGLEPNAQGKLLLEFVPMTRYATVTAIEIIQE